MWDDLFKGLKTLLKKVQYVYTFSFFNVNQNNNHCHYTIYQILPQTGQITPIIVSNLMSGINWILVCDHSFLPYILFYILIKFFLRLLCVLS